MDEDDCGASRHRLYPFTKDDLARVPAREAREVLTKYAPLVQGFVRRFPRHYLGAHFDSEDLQALGQVLLLQFWVIYDPAKAPGGSFQGWATFLFRQAFAKISRALSTGREIPIDLERAAQAAGSSAGDSTRVAFSGLVLGTDAWVRENLAEEPEYDEAVRYRQQLELYERALARLTPRHRFVLEGLRQGRTTAQIAEDLGVIRQRVDQLHKIALAEVQTEVRRLMAADQELEEDEEPDPVRRELDASLETARGPTLSPWPATRSASLSSPS